MKPKIMVFKNRYGQLRSGWKIALMMLGSINAILFFGMIFGMILGIFYAAQSMANGTMDLQQLTDTVQSDQVSSVLMMFVQEAVLIAAPIIAWKLLMKRPLTNMGFAPLKKKTTLDLIVGLLFGIISISIVFLFLIFSGNAEVVSWKPHFTISQLIYIPVFISVGFAEELFSRGYIMSVLRQTKSTPVTVLISAIIFALMHSFNSGVSKIAYINLTLVGILFAFMYLRSGTIWMCIGYHITWNYFQGYVYGFKVSGLDSEGIITTQSSTDNIYNGGAFGPEGGLFVTMVLVVGLLFVLFYYRNSKFNFIASEPTIQVQSKETTIIQNEV